MKKSNALLGSAECLAMAAAQHGLLTRQQLTGLGLLTAQITAAVKGGALKRVGPSLYELQVSEDRWRRALSFAALWVSNGVFSHRTAGLLHGIDGVSSAPVEMSVSGWRKPRRGIKLHEGQAVPENHRAMVKGFPVTSVNWTLIDLAAVLTDEKLAWAVEYSWRMGLTNPFELRLLFEERRRRGLEGVERFERILSDCEGRLRPFDSGCEVRMWRVCKRERLRPEPQLSVYDAEGELRIDFAFAYERTALETMGAKWHEGAHNLEKDCARALRLSALGWTVVPVTWAMLDTDRAGVVRRLKAALRTHDPRNTRSACVAGQLGFDSDHLFHPAPQVARWRDPAMRARTRSA